MSLGEIVRGVLPFVALMFVAVVLICAIPQIATALPDAAMGAPRNDSRGC
jgi:C4-dicarboxylate transporter DctM subunit